MAQKQPMDWPAVLAELHRRGMTLAELALRNDIPGTSMRRIKSSTHYKGQAAVAEFLGMKPEDIWPTRYPIRKPRILDTVKNPRPEREIAQPDADKRAAA